MPASRERELYLEGIRLFNEHSFFEAHEVWEEIWVTAQGDRNRFYQGMIQCAVALEHYRRSNPRGVVSLRRTYAKHLAGLPPVYMGINLETFLAEMDAVLRPVTTSSVPLERGSITLDPATVPVLRLEGDPFEEKAGE